MEQLNPLPTLRGFRKLSVPKNNPSFISKIIGRTNKIVYQSQDDEIYGPNKTCWRGSVVKINGKIWPNGKGYFYDQKNTDGQKKYVISSRKINNNSFYTGEWKNGKPEGYGIRKINNYSFYTGEWKAGEQEGYGMINWASGNSYEGEWKAGELEGYGKFTLANGDYYEGEWKAGEREGQGTFTWAEDGDYYEGEWKAGEQEGYGMINWASGNSYEGEWKAGEREGQGTFTCKNHYLI